MNSNIVQLFSDIENTLNKSPITEKDANIIKQYMPNFLNTILEKRHSSS